MAGSARKYKQRAVRPLVDRFWEKVEKGPGCWEWTASKDSGGYGQIGAGLADCGTLKAHRVSWELANGPIPEGLQVLHACDNPGCVRPGPRHLFLGTHQDNMDDMKSKGRSPVTHGENNSRAKLTEVGVRYIRDSSERAVTLSVRFGVSESTIRNVRTGRKWQRVGGRVSFQRDRRQGESHHASKLTDSDVRFIRNCSDSTAVLAAKFGVATFTIWKIRTGRSWRHLG